MITPDPDLSQAASQSHKGTNAWGPRHIRRWTPPHSRRLEETPHAGPRHVRHNTPRHKSVSEVAIRMEAELPRFLEPRKNSHAPTEDRHHLIATPMQKAPAAMPASQGSHLCRLSDDLSHRSSLVELSHPPQSIASQVIARCRCHERHRLTLSCTTLTVA